MTTNLEQKLRNHPMVCLTDTELAAILDVADHQKYGQIKRAAKKGALIHVRRGLYCLGNQLTVKKPHPFVLAQEIYWPSYLSLETALAYYGLIPEAVYTITSVTTKRTKEFQTHFGNFSYQKLPTNNFFTEVKLIKENDYSFFIALPWKAITDYVYCNKKNWQGLDPLLQDLRINLDDLPQLSLEKTRVLSAFYQSTRIEKFLCGIKKELKL